MASAGNGRRVLVIVQNLPVPFDRRVWLEATSLTRAGYAVSVICPKAKGYTASFETLEGVDIHRYDLPIEAQGAMGFALEFAWCFLLSFMKSVRVALAGRGFDIIHACNPPETYWLLARFWRLFGKRFLFDHHDLSPEMYAAKFGRDSGLLYQALLFFERMTFRSADVVMTTNESHKRIAQARGGMAPEDVFVVRSGPDVARFRLFEPDPRWRNGKRFLLVYLGEMCRQDGVDHLVRAVRILHQDLKRDDLHAVFVGGGPEQPLIRAYAAEQGVGDLCTFTGRVSDDDLCRILSSADVAVDPDPKTAWSDQSTMNKIMEYMFFGLPIVCYDLTEHKVSAQHAALYVEANSERALAQGISDLLDDPARRARMARFGAERVREKLSWQHSVPPLLAAYEAIFARAQRAPSVRSVPQESAGPPSRRRPTATGKATDRRRSSSLTPTPPSPARGRDPTAPGPTHRALLSEAMAAGQDDRALPLAADGGRQDRPRLPQGADGSRPDVRPSPLMGERWGGGEVAGPETPWGCCALRISLPGRRAGCAPARSPRCSSGRSQSGGP